MRIVFSFIICLLLLTGYLSAQNRLADLPFRDGEELTLSFAYKWGGLVTEVAEGVAKLKLHDNSNGTPFFHARINGYTHKFYDLFFKVRDFYESKFYVETLRPFYFHRDVEEGKYRTKNVITFHAENRVESIINRMDDPRRDTVLKGNDFTFDIISLFYYARTIDFERARVNDRFPASFVIDGVRNDISIRYIGKETKSIPGLGRFGAAKFGVKLLSGTVLKGDKEMFVWISDDANKLLLAIDVEIKVGKLTGTLKSVKNLKYPQYLTNR